MAQFTIGKMAGMAGVNVQTIRYYEKRGLMPRPRSKGSAYRQYEEQHVVRLRFILHAKELGFTLNEIGELLSLRVSKSMQCADIRRLAEIKMREIDSRISDLGKLKRTLEKLVDQCKREGIESQCPILDLLEE